MKCRKKCAACCIAISISSPLPGMPRGKPAGIPCINLNPDFSCAIWKSQIYPAVCKDFSPSLYYCGKNTCEAYSNIIELEKLTS